MLDLRIFFLIIGGVLIINSSSRIERFYRDWSFYRGNESL